MTSPASTAIPPRKHGFLFHAFLVLFTLFAIPILIALPFLLSGFIGRP